MLVSITGSQTESRAMVFSTWIEIKTFLSNFFFFFQINFYVQELFVSFYPYLPHLHCPIELIWLQTRNKKHLFSRWKEEEEKKWLPTQFPTLVLVITLLMYLACWGISNYLRFWFVIDCVFHDVGRWFFFLFFFLFSPEQTFHPEQCIIEYEALANNFTIVHFIFYFFNRFDWFLIDLCFFMQRNCVPYSLLIH